MPTPTPDPELLMSNGKIAKYASMDDKLILISQDDLALKVFTRMYQEEAATGLPHASAKARAREFVLSNMFSHEFLKQWLCDSMDRERELGMPRDESLGTEGGLKGQERAIQLTTKMCIQSFAQLVESCALVGDKLVEQNDGSLLIVPILDDPNLLSRYSILAFCQRSSIDSALLPGFDFLSSGLRAIFPVARRYSLPPPHFSSDFAEKWENRSCARGPRIVSF